MVLVQTFIFEMLNFSKWIICLFVNKLTNPSFLKVSKAFACPQKRCKGKLQQLNYLPISVVPILFKVFKLLLHYQLVSSGQFGFRPNLSTSKEACFLIQDCLGSIESRKPCVFRSFEMSKILTPQSIASLINRRLINFQGVSFRLCLQL